MIRLRQGYAGQARPVYLRRRRRAWHSPRFRDGLFVGVLAGVIAYGLFVNVIERVWG